MDHEKAIRAAKLTLGGILEKRRAKTAVERAEGQIAPSKYMPGVPRQVHANGGYVPAASLPIPRLAVASPLAMNRQPGFLDVLGTLNKVAGSARSISDLVSPEKEKAPHAERVEARSEGLTPEATAAMEALRKGWAGADFGIVSGYRTPEENRAAKGAKDSQHTHGNAYDVNTTGWSPEDKLALADAAWNAGFRGFGFYDNNMHFDVGGERAWGPSYSRDSIPEWAQGWASQRYGYADGGPAGMGDNGGPPLSEPPVDLGQAREQKQMQTFHSGLMDDIHTRMTHAMEAHQKAVDAGVFDGYEVGDTLQGSAHPMRVTGRYMQAWKPTTMALRSFERMNTKPTIIEHEGKQYIPMLRYRTGKEGVDGFQEGSAYLDGVKAAGYQKMGGLRAVKAAGGAAMFQDIHPDLQDDQGKPMDLYHGTPGEGFSEFKDENLGKRDTGFYGRGHYLTPDQGSAEEYADPNQMGSGTVMGPLHAALKNPYVWDMSNETKAYSTLKDLHSMGIMRDRNTRMNPWDNLKSHEINTFMEHMGKRGHDGVIVKQPNWQDGEGSSVSEIVVFKPSAIKHKDAKSFDPNDPNIYHARGGVAK
jgi:hypothetical protein